MDEIDMKIITLLLVNSRLSYREIASYLGLSVNAVYKRVQILIELDVIHKFTARINPYAVNAIYTLIFGESKAENINLVASNLGEHENTYNIILSSRNYLYIGALLKNIHELDEYSSFVSQTAEIQNPSVGLLHGVYYSSPKRYKVPISRTIATNLDKLDIEIIRSLNRDSRKPISEVADDINSTSNTVRRRLNRMIKEGLIELSIQFNPVSSSDIFALLQISLSHSSNKEEVAQYIADNYQPNIFFCWAFSNLPNLLLCYTWCNNMNELNTIIQRLKKDKVESVIADVLLKGLFYDTWKEKMLYE
ncbi:MAG: AsnC family transcriptional regulator [Candidatus Thorarchaeota archaeon]